MRTFDALLAGGLMTAAAFAVLYFRRALNARMALLIAVASLASSTASMLVFREGLSGTLLRRMRGYPKPFYFISDGQWSFEPIYFAANTLVHFGTIALLAAALGGQWSRMGGPVLIRFALGFVFLILGVIGSLLPIMQGWVFFLLAFLVFFPRSKWTEKIVQKVGHKMPRFERFLRKMGIGDMPPQPHDTMRVE